MSGSPLAPPSTALDPPTLANPDPPTAAPLPTEDTLMPDATAIDPSSAPGGPSADELAEAATAQAEADAGKAADEEWLRAEKERKERESWSETLYIQNLNEKVQLPILKQSLRSLFKSYGEVLDVVAHSNLRMRGQAFVSFTDKEIAAKAQKEVKGFPLYGKPMQISFAKTKSDAVVRKTAPDSIDEHVEGRKEHKKKARLTNPHRKRAIALHKASLVDPNAPVDPSADPSSSTTDAPVPAPSKKQPIQMPDEYLPPNPTLFIQELPDGTQKADLEEVFSKYPNLVSVRMIPAKKEIAFVDFGDEASSTLARDGLNGHVLEGKTGPMRVTFARR